MLCDLGLAAEAEDLLAQQRETFEAVDDLFAGAVLRCLEGRVALGLGRFDDAADSFRGSRDAFLTLGRPYDAALACLDLAHVYLNTGRSVELQRLATGLISLFRAHGVARETLAAVRLLAEALAQEHVTSALLQDLRRQIETRCGAPGSSVG